MGCHTYTSVKNKTEKITLIWTKMLPHFGMQWETASGCTCNVLPSPIECAKMQPNPVEVVNLDSDSTTLSNKKRTPPIWSTNITNINHEL